jgi:hypothetical protein
MPTIWLAVCALTMLTDLAGAGPLSRHGELGGIRRIATVPVDGHGDVVAAGGSVMPGTVNPVSDIPVISPLTCRVGLQYSKEKRDMSNENQSGQPQDVANLIGRFLSRIPKLYAGDQVGNLLSMAAFIDSAIVRVISSYFVSDKAKASYLADNIVDKMSLDRKLAILKYVLGQNSWESEFPKLIPQLRGLFSLRNELAHSFLDDEVREEGDDIVFTRYSWRDGDYKEVSVSLSAVTNTKETAEREILENLMIIISRIEAVE